jgi:phosphate-selective porin
MGIDWVVALAALAQDAAPPHAPGSPPASQVPTSQPLVLTAGYDDHFFLQDALGENRLEIGGLLQVQANFFERGLHGRDSDVFLRRMRLEIGGRIEGDWLFNLEPKFTEHDFEFEEAWIGCEPESGLTAMAGRMKEPFSLEEARPVKHIAFVNLSLLNQFVPAEGHGLTFQSEPRTGGYEWGAAIYQGGEEGMNGGSEGAGRFVVRPFANGAPALRRLQIGAAATIGRNDDPLGGVEWNNEARVPFATLDPLAEANGDHLRLGVEGAWWTGPFELSAEAMRNEQEVEGPLGDEDAVMQSWYGALAWVVTGEERTVKAVHPTRPFELRGARGPGAVEVAARVTRLQIGEGWSESGALPAGSDPRRVTSFDVGVNWYLTWHARVKLHALLTQYSEPVMVGGHALDDEKALLVQLQLHF